MRVLGGAGGGGRGDEECRWRWERVCRTGRVLRREGRHEEPERVTWENMMYITR